MRITNLHTICILALGSILTSGFDASAQLDPNMEAGVECSSANCIFRGNSQTHDAISGFQKLPTTSGEAKLIKVSRYEDNMDFVVDRKLETQFSPIGELETKTVVKDEKGNDVRLYGTGVLISPCYIITNHHVAFGDDVEPVAGKDYSMTFRVGAGPNPNTAFLGNTTATPVVWGNYGACHSNDWAIMKLKTCVGGIQKLGIGWMETSDKSARALVGNDISVAGYAADKARGQLSFSTGKAKGFDPRSGMVKHSASAAGGQSGAAVIVKENGIAKLAGLHTVEFSGDSQSATFKSYSDENTNEFTSIYEIVNRPDIKAMLDQDKAAVGANPAMNSFSRPMPSRAATKSI